MASLQPSPIPSPGNGNLASSTKLGKSHVRKSELLGQPLYWRRPDFLVQLIPSKLNLFKVHALPLWYGLSSIEHLLVVTPDAPLGRRRRYNLRNLTVFARTAGGGQGGICPTNQKHSLGYLSIRRSGTAVGTFSIHGGSLSNWAALTDAWTTSRPASTVLCEHYEQVHSPYKGLLQLKRVYVPSQSKRKTTNGAAQQRRDERAKRHGRQQSR